MGTTKMLNAETADFETQSRYRAAASSPVRVLQIGEGNFLRGFADWMLHECRKKGLFDGSVAVTQPRPSGGAKLEQLAAQDGLYTLLIRGLEQGRKVERSEVVAVFRELIDPYREWQRFLSLAERPELEAVISNTTEAGLTYVYTPWKPDEPMPSYPARLTLWLYRRYEAFAGAADKGLLLLPCELLERNGDTLKACVLRHCDDWSLPDGFRRWLEEHNRFLNSLVDRIVTGYPADEAPALFERWGYEDLLLNTAEPYHFWAIEGEPELDRRLPFVQAGLNVRWVPDLLPYQLRKVRILNGAHTLMTPLGLLSGVRHVRELMEHETLGSWVREAVAEEIVSAVPLEPSELRVYAAEVFERFANPYIEHRLSDIAMNSVSKFRTRLVPTLLSYAGERRELPQRMVTALAALLRLYRVKRLDDGGYGGVRFDGTPYTVNDSKPVLETMSALWAEYGTDARLLADAVLSREEWWGCDLRTPAGLPLVQAIARQLEQWEEYE